MKMDANIEKFFLMACWECRENGDPWEYDCDQCNPDGQYDRNGQQRPDYA